MHKVAFRVALPHFGCKSFHAPAGHDDNSPVLIASSLARLIRRERGSRPVIEAHFQPSEGRRAHVHFENGKCELVLLTNAPGGESDVERTEVSARQGKFLIDVSAGIVGYNSVRLAMSTRELAINCFDSPGLLGIAEMEFDNEEDAASFKPPLWFGPEVTEEPPYDPQSIAINGLPNLPEIPLSDASLHAVLDILEPSTRRSFEAAAHEDAPGHLRPVTANPKSRTATSSGG